MKKLFASALLLGFCLSLQVFSSRAVLANPNGFCAGSIAKVDFTKLPSPLPELGDSVDLNFWGPAYDAPQIRVDMREAMIQAWGTDATGKRGRTSFMALQQYGHMFGRAYNYTGATIAYHFTTAVPNFGDGTETVTGRLIADVTVLPKNLAPGVYTNLSTPVQFSDLSANFKGNTLTLTFNVNGKPYTLSGTKVLGNGRNGHLMSFGCAGSGSN